MLIKKMILDVSYGITEEIGEKAILRVWKDRMRALWLLICG